MDTATKNSSDTFILKHEKNKKGHPHRKENFSLDFTMTSSRQNLFYILNTSFLVIIAFIAGYNLKSREIRQDINTTIQSAEQYIQKAKANYVRSEKLLADIKNSGNTHFESTVVKFPKKLQADLMTKPDSESITFSEAISPPPVQSEIQGATKQIKKTNLPQKPIPGINISHTIKKGDSLSSLVEKAAMADFLKSNPQISNPDLIYPGQKVIINIPKQSILTGSYLNNYFIRPVTASNGERTYTLTKSFTIPESETLLSHIIKQNRQLIGKATTPYINLSDFTNTMKEEIWDGNAIIKSRKTKISNVVITQTGVHFDTVRSHPVFSINNYKGVKSIKNPDYYKHLDIIKDYLIKYLASLKPGKPVNTLFHFMIFGETIVQTDFIEAAAFDESAGKSKITIGLVYTNNQTRDVLFKLQRTLSTCKIKKGEIIELSQENFISYQQ